MLKIQPNLDIFRFKKSKVETLVIDSLALKDNPLRDDSVRMNPMLLPKEPKANMPVVFVLAGFTGNGPKYFAPKSFAMNAVETLAHAVDQRQAPEALYIFVDAMTFWGGSQFVNSQGMGNYEDYIIKDLVPAIKANFDVAEEPERWCVTGGSSGGYGALHLASEHPDIFATCAAIAPDGFFALSLLPEIYKAMPIIEKMGGVRGVRSEMEAGRFFKMRDSHLVLNVVAMGLCYACTGREKINWPINKQGILDKEIWQQWLAHDPLYFIGKRKKKVEKLKQVYLDVGKCDQYHLQYGCRQLTTSLKELKVSVTSNEFDGTHYDLGEQRPQLWSWLRRNWN